MIMKKNPKKTNQTKLGDKQLLANHFEYGWTLVSQKNNMASYLNQENPRILSVCDMKGFLAECNPILILPQGEKVVYFGGLDNWRYNIGVDDHGFVSIAG